MKNILTIKDLLKGYKKKEYSSVDVIKHFGSVSKSLQIKLNHYITLNEDLKNIPKNAIPIAYKDIYSTKGIKTTAASKILDNYVPPFSATSIKKLEENNFYSLGKLNCDAFAHGSSGENSDYGPTKNPYNLSKVPGGSSSGSAVAVSSLSALVAMATDTGGSIRCPANYTNTVGIKPTYGRVSRYGVVSMTSSTDSIGHITKTVWDSAYILNITAGADKFDATTSTEPVPNYTSDLENFNVNGLKIGLPKEYFDKSVNAKISTQVKNTLDILKSKGAKLIPVELPHTKYGIATYYIITPSEISSNLARFTGIRYGNKRDSFGDEAVRRIMIGTFALSSGYYDAYYKKAQRVRNAIAEDFENVFKNVDIIAGPVTPDFAPNLGEVINDPLKNYLTDVLTVNVNLAGLPALSIPAGFVEKMPVGLQLIGPKFAEHLLFKVGSVIEKETEYYKILPKI
ncbi:Asp-tRNA(Asn)/Glu-tRNA(Gln) amidotransferase GatCAB subunit A [candidate division WWE3 bacterium CG10_big_fil_rev_8_21_14_0_10_32_10]|uniref:Glutamyl-tRNA(Gln) amidotransferase subunit A n=1 Tax=candidate division WWE3 bacterium CG10_big_fil_rev_8_21_14_0_10_32_10 TaxID=1975090 RepID=A0A2H0RA45_UNCKA|nr:MAG: Asp-tRNA(Asn)/Glu-tRNA(Gln) amidotransferase GatCAB subunit A [candidate division WWE3 bacterium CG10_big_fil_rev_8_21_14_0_10_32_10]